ncbi:hypothetical protein HMPREF0454_04776 [Hafnia alvei ATCC 51873]|uniref:Uncharacterized protein n=1 Tax=Hafnia alvei ATCC 51873 TaxID=1002364 RepID=G9YDS8_HAFAL|nr:hypothetical protein HMPREF0454_04776 [Hafnia alvei ATCC 51873]
MFSIIGTDHSGLKLWDNRTYLEEKFTVFISNSKMINLVM